MNALEFAGTILHSIKINEKFQIIPVGQVLWSYAREEFYGTITNSSSFSIAAVCMVVYKKFYVYPKLRYSEGFYYISGGLGFIIPTNIRRNKKVQ